MDANPRPRHGGGQKRRYLAVDAWPEADRKAWEAALTPGNVLEPGGGASTWAAPTRRGVTNAYARWLTWLTTTKRLDPAMSPADRVTREAVVAYVTDLRAQIASTTLCTYIRDLRGALKVMAPDRDWRWLRTVICKLDRSAVPMRNKRLRVIPSGDLYAFGVELMEQADADTTRTPLVQACDYRDGLLIALLAARPLRRRNLTEIRIDTHLVKTGDGYMLLFEDTETKTKAPIEIPFPGMLIPYLERYLDQHRAFLAQPFTRLDGTRGGGDADTSLWMSTRRTAMSQAAVYTAITKLTAERFGHGIGPQLFRDCAATSIATEDPEHVRMTANILGHTSLKTSEKFYNHANSLVASRQHQEHMRTLRKPPGKRRRTSPTRKATGSKRSDTGR